VYFVADGTGGHVFAETLEQHARNVARWRQVEKARAVGGETPVDRVEPPPEGRTDGPASPGAASAFAAGTAAPGGARPRAFDAVEGTTRDPLLNRSYDLNSPKNVPSLRQ
jgi:UPF0755 protein